MKLLKMAAVAAGVLALGTASLAQKPLQKLGKGEGKVDIVAWAGYIERGATDKNFDWVTDFEKKTGCKVNVKTAGTSDEMVALMNEGGFDLVTASGDASSAADPRQEGAADQRQPDPELQEHRPAAAEGALALREQHPLRRAVPVGLERADVQHQGLQGQAAHQLERGVRGDRRCPTARATRAACRPSTGRSTSPTPRCT